MGKARQCPRRDRLELPRRHVPSHREVTGPGLQALADSEYLDAVLPQVAHHLENLGVGPTEPQHEPGLGRHVRSAPPERLQRTERMPVVGVRPRLPIA